MQKNPITDIVLRAKSLEPGLVTSEEVEIARLILRRRSDGIIDAIHVVGLCGSAGDALVLEGYLLGEENNVYAEYALKALCRYLGLIDHYRPLLRQWMKNKADNSRRMSSINLATEYFRDFSDNELGQYLIDVLCDINDGCRDAVRGAFVDIFDLRTKLKDPFGLHFDDWDQDTTSIVKVAASEFGYQERITVSGRAVH